MTIPAQTTQTDTAQATRTEITDPRRRLAFVPRLFATALGESMTATFLRKHSDYDGGMWHFYEVPDRYGHHLPDRLHRPARRHIPADNPGKLF
jgi:hypothetical protein